MPRKQLPIDVLGCLASLQSRLIEFVEMAEMCQRLDSRPGALVQMAVSRAKGLHADVAELLNDLDKSERNKPCPQDLHEEAAEIVKRASSRKRGGK